MASTEKGREFTDWQLAIWECCKETKWTDGELFFSLWFYELIGM